MYHLRLKQPDVEQAVALVDRLARTLSRAEHPELSADLAIYAHDLPLSLRRFLNDFRLRETFGLAIVSGFPVDDSAIGPTPAHWRNRDNADRTLRHEIYFLLCAALLGEPIGWATQQDGYLVHDVLPIRGHEDEQISSGSEQTIFWHTEDAFHPYRGDYVGLYCLRNPERIETTFAGIDMLEIDEADARVLSEPRYVIRPDNSHLESLSGGENDRLDGAAEMLDAARVRIKKMMADAVPQPILFGSPRAPYLCLDPYFMPVDCLDEESAGAFGRLRAEIDAKLTGAALQPGDVCFVDNFRAVHGRSSFTARFDGTDRWLKRLCVARDLRKSRDARWDAESRLIF